MRKIYLDNGSTSFPKAPGLGEVMSRFITDVGCNVGRGGYETAFDLGVKVYETRELLCDFFHFSQPQNVVFTPGITYSLNYIIKGIIRPGDHIIISSVDHNAVVRPCRQMEEQGAVLDIAPCHEDGTLDLASFTSLIGERTKMVVMTHGSNVSGTVLDAEAVGDICRKHGIYFVLDGAQTAGILPIDFEKFSLSALCLTGHKGLLGPQGIGAMLLRDDLAAEMKPLIGGGTGSVSDRFEMPDFMPDKFEAGTLNLPGILGLNHGLSYILETGMEAIAERERSLAEKFSAEMDMLDGVRRVGKKDINDKNDKNECVGIVSLDFRDIDNGEMACLLDERYGIMTRCGLHCAPLAHQTFATFPQGTVRFAFGYRNTEAEVDYTVKAIKDILKDI